MLIRNEVVDSVCEFAESRFLVHVKDTDLLIIQYWQVIHTVNEPDPTNIEKYWMSPLPYFHPVTFPFLVCSGKKTFNIINVQTSRMDVLIKGSAQNHDV